MDYNRTLTFTGFRLKVAQFRTNNRQRELYSTLFQHIYDDKSAGAKTYIIVGLLEFVSTTAYRNILLGKQTPYNPEH